MPEYKPFNSLSLEFPNTKPAARMVSTGDVLNGVGGKSDGKLESEKNLAWFSVSL